eukprot:GHVO01062903.1.p1 GENE.GHVO01062903.1~~GHVO01062903.1.p1  ORF type:complete len:205 (+),score=23.14 GHVO01062903.1:315-929(+)
MFSLEKPETAEKLQKSDICRLYEPVAVGRSGKNIMYRGPSTSTSGRREAEVLSQRLDSALIPTRAAGGAGYNRGEREASILECLDELIRQMHFGGASDRARILFRIRQDRASQLQLLRTCFQEACRTSAIEAEATMRSVEAAHATVEAAQNKVDTAHNEIEAMKLENEKLKMLLAARRAVIKRAMEEKENALSKQLMTLNEAFL